MAVKEIKLNLENKKKRAETLNDQQKNSIKRNIMLQKNIFMLPEMRGIRFPKT